MRRWLKFNLKTLFLAVLVAAVAAMAFERYWVTRPLVWQPFSAKARDDALASGKLVLIIFTAGWDFESAKLDQAFANSAELRSLIRRHGIVTIEADYTRQTRPIANEVIRVYGQEVVPVLAVYRPDKPDAPYFAGYVVEEVDLLEILRRALAAEPAPAGNSFLPKAD